MDEMKASILIQAKADDNQIKKEVDKAGNEIQQESKKARTKIVIEADIKDAQEKFNKLSAEYKELKNRSASPVVLKAKVDEMRKANDEIVSLRKELRNVQDTANNTGGAIQNLITKFAGFFAIQKIFSFLIDTFNNFQQAQKEIVLATGATGDALRDLTNSMLDVQGSV
jgi:chromosome segregation ATPase